MESQIYWECGAGYFATASLRVTLPDGGAALDVVQGIQGQIRLKQLDLGGAVAVESVVALCLHLLIARGHLLQCSSTLAQLPSWASCVSSLASIVVA